LKDPKVKTRNVFLKTTWLTTRCYAVEAHL